MDKVITQEALIAAHSSLPTASYALAHGVFDVLHPGHVEHLRQAKALADRLVVAILADRHVTKGPGRPVFSAEQRAKVLSELQVVDYVVICDSPVALDLINALKPEVYCKGQDYMAHNRYSDGFAAEVKAVKAYGGQVALTDGFKSSSTLLVEEYGLANPLPSTIRDQLSYSGVIDWMNRASRASALVIGEPILDRYVYVSPLGKSAKEGLVSFMPEGTKDYRGGAWIVLQDAAEFNASCDYQEYGIPPVIKQRYVEQAFNQKLFSLIDHVHVPEAAMVPTPEGYDLFIIADYGHGLLSEQIAGQIAALPIFLALTVQSNSANWGFNLLTKWPRADYVVVDQNELRLACHSQYGDITELARQQAVRMATKLFVVTLGHEGCIAVAGDTFINCPALSTKLVDRMGAGDAFLAATASLAWAGAPAAVIALIGNVAGGLKCGKVGNQVVTRHEVENRLRQLL